MHIPMTKQQRRAARRAEALAAIPAGDCLLTAEQIAARLGVALRTFVRLVERGHFPRPALHANRRLVRWHSKQLQQYLDELWRPNRPAASA